MIRQLKLPASLALVLGSAFLFTSPTSAHHAFASEFDSSRPLSVRGKVTKVRYVNPHSWIYVDVTDRSGKVTNWGFEFGTPSSLRSMGITRDAITIGSSVRIAGFRAKNGGAFGYSTTLVLEDGRKFDTGSAPDAPAPPVL